MRCFRSGAIFRGLAGGAPARERIVKTSLAYLKQLSRDAGNDLDLELDNQGAYRAVADIQGGVQTVNLGQSDEALVKPCKGRRIYTGCLEKRDLIIRV